MMFPIMERVMAVNPIHLRRIGRTGRMKGKSMMVVVVVGQEWYVVSRCGEGKSTMSNGLIDQSYSRSGLD